LPRPVALAVSAVGLVAATGLATTWLTHSTPPPASPAMQTAGVIGDGAPCHVDYRLTQDTGDRFTAKITVRNTGDEAYKDWRLIFGLPGDQHADSPEWTEDAGVVTSLRRADELAPGTAVDFAFAGRYSGVNPFPTAFVLDDQRCSASLLGLTGVAVPVTVTVTAPPERVAAPLRRPPGPPPHHGKDKDREKGKEKDKGRP